MVSRRPQPFDIVRTPNGNIAIVTEAHSFDDYDGGCSITFLPHQEIEFPEKNAWWQDGDGLEILGSIVQVIANSMAHPFGSNRKQGEKFFPRKKT